ncbi:MAG: hypothetical protein ACK5N8_07945 [Alphaproteobacteria bacterium]
MKTIKQTLIEKIALIIQDGNLEDLDMIKQEICIVLDKGTNTLKSPFHNPLLQEKYNTLDIIDRRKDKYLKRFQEYVWETQCEYDAKTYGHAKVIAVEKLIDDFTEQVQKISKNPRKETKLFLELKLFDFFFKKYTNQQNGKYKKKYEELICVCLYCESEKIKSLFKNFYSYE